MSNEKWGVFFGFLVFLVKGVGKEVLTLMVVLVWLVVDFFLLLFLPPLPPLDMFQHY